MLEIFSSLSPAMVALLLLALGLVFFFEFINGFHDTANAVATVIYTQSMKPVHAVIASGTFNFLGVVTGGLAVAYAIVNLLPIDLLASGNTKVLLAMVFSLLLAAIIWNLGTWYFGLPASSSHTLIGAILGVGVANALMEGQSFTTGVNWNKAMDVGASLLFSPMAGFILAYVMLAVLRKLMPIGKIHQTPYLRNGVRGKKHPPFWTRFLLILSAMGVSFAHGSNDGQKGIGLAMLTLICILPSHYVVNSSINQYDLERSLSSVTRLELFIQQNQASIQAAFPAAPAIATGKEKVHCQPADALTYGQNVRQLMAGSHEISHFNTDQRWALRTNLLCLEDSAKKLAAMPGNSPEQKAYLQQVGKDFSLPVEYAPLWVIVAIALSLGIGTMIGWKRVVTTVGEGIGKSHMTYAQGVCAQVTAAVGIAGANLFGLPVSTTQILSSAVAGTAVANKSGLQWSTIRNILLAWIFTFPVAMGISGGLYFLIRMVF